MNKFRKGWEKVKLGQIMDFKNGLNFTKSDKGETIKIVGVSDFRDLFELQSTSDLDVISVSNKIKDDELLSDGDLLFVRSNGNKALIGRCLYFSNVKERLSFSGFTIRGRVTSKKVFPLYIAHLAKSEIIREAINKQGGGTNISNLSQQILNDIVVHLPPLPEQIKIAEILSTWDNAIQTTEKQLANSQQQKKALMQMLLSGEKRVAGFSGEWGKAKLGNVAKMSSGGTPKSTIKEYYNGDIKWVSIADMTKQGKYILETEKTLSQLGLENSSAKLFPENTILYAMYASIGECSIAKVPVTSSQAILGIQPSEVLYFEYLYFYLCSLKDRIKLQGQQGTQANLNAGMVKDFDILLPSIDEQQKIAEILTTADQEIETLQKKLECLKLEKRALMQGLL